MAYDAMFRFVRVLLLVTAVLWPSACAVPPAAPPPPPPTAALPSEPPLKPTIIAAPPIWQSPAEVASSCGQHLTAAGQLRDELVASTGDRTLRTTLVPVNDILIEVDQVMGLAELMASVHPNKAVREAAEQCHQQAQKFVSDLKLDRRVYDALVAVQTDGLDAGAKRFVERLLRDYRRAGVDRDDATRTLLATLQEQMVKLGQDYRRAIREDKRFIEVLPAELAGLPQDYLDKHKPGKDGKVRITTDYPDLLPLLKYADQENVRRALWLQSVNRAHPENEPVLKKLLTLRHQYATALGHADWASYNAGDKMLDDKQKVAQFIDRVAAIARPRMARELTDLLARKRQDVKRADTVRSWDRFYYVIKLQKERYGVDSQVVRAYFPYERVKQGVLDVNQALFGITFRKVDDAPVWHESVEAYEVLEAGTPIARFYLDMHPRDGKYGHAGAFSMLSGVAGRQLPSATLVCNFPDPSKGGSALMEHGDVVTFFHELGHLVHHLFSGRHRWVTFSAYNVEWDFVETPSQLIEEWAWSPDVLRRFALHYQTNQPIDEALVRKMRQADEFGKGVDVMRQMFLAALSLHYHNQDPQNLDLLGVIQQLRERYSPYPYEEGTHFFANFGHLEGYSSTYYTYMWSLVLVKDLFARFEQGGIMNADTAAAYRRAVVAPGASQDAVDMVASFLGRPHSFDAFHKWLERN